MERGTLEWVEVLVMVAAATASTMDAWIVIMVIEVAVLVAAAKMKVAVVIDGGTNNYVQRMVFWSGQHNIYNDDRLVIYFHTCMDVKKCLILFTSLICGKMKEPAF